MNRTIRAFVTTLTLLLSSATFGEETPKGASECTVTITEPKARQEVGVRLLIEGRATIPAGHHLWAFARHEAFQPLWWPQNEARIGEDGKFKVFASIGEPHDIGFDFDLSIAVFAEPEHLKLKAEHTRAMTTGDFRPIPMPQASCPPLTLTVKKVSHK